MYIYCIHKFQNITTAYILITIHDDENVYNIVIVLN